MNSSIALRLLWKEYRVQRGLWLSMAAGSFLLQGLIVMLIPDRGQEAFQGIVPVAFMLTGFYAIGSGAITFAIEREDGTQLRPVMLGCPAGLTLTVKTVFGIVATVLLLAVTMISGLLMSMGSLSLPANTIHPETAKLIVPLTLLFVVLPYVGALLWAMFFSLLTRKVIVALGLAAVAMIVSYTVVAIYAVEVIERPHIRQYGSSMTGQQVFLISVLPCFLALMILALNYLLTRRWLTRAFFDQTAARTPAFFKRWRIRRSGLDGGMVVEIGVEDRTAFDVISADIAVHQPPPRLGLSLLYATWGANLWRHLRFLRWKEAIETRRIFVGFLLATLLLTFWCVMENMNGMGWHGLVGFFIHAACVACGAMAFRAEQDGQKVQRLADMGLRPATVWLSKHVVWFFRAVISVSALLLCVFFLEWCYSHSSVRMRVSDFLHSIWLNIQLSGRAQDHASELRLVGRAAIVMLTMYGVGQLCSQLIRSTIVSLFVAFVVALTVFGWAAACFWFEVPFVLSVLPVGIGCFLATWYRTGSWMKGDDRLKVWTWPTGAIATTLAVACVATGLFRVYQVPSSEPFFEQNDGLTSEQREFVLAPVSAEERESFARFQRASDLLESIRLDQRIGRQPAQEIWEELSRDEQQTLEDAVSIVLEAAYSPASAVLSPATSTIADVHDSSAFQPMHHALDLVLFDADRQLAETGPAEALARYRRALAICRLAAGRGIEMNWWWSQQLTQETLTAMQEWGRHPDVDEELVDEAVEMIDSHREQMLPIEVTNFASAVTVRNTLDADTFVLAELVEESRRLPMLLSTRFPGEHARSHRLLNLLESYDVASMKSYREWQKAAKSSVGHGMAQWMDRHYSRDVELRNISQSCLRSTPLLAYIASGPASSQLCLADINIEVRSRATRLLIQLLVRQRTSEALPETLDVFGESLHDPWTDRPFVWYPDGLSGDLKQGGAVTVPAGTPFFMSTGQERLRILRVESVIPVSDFGASHSDVRTDAGGAGFNSLGSGSDMDAGSDPATSSKPADAGSEPVNAAAQDDDDIDLSKHVIEYVVQDDRHRASSRNLMIWQLETKPKPTGEAEVAPE